MRALLLPCCLLFAMLLQAGPVGQAEDPDWEDCLSCHTEMATQLPALESLRPRLNATEPKESCESCHSRGLPDFFAGDWTHPVRPLGNHIGCTNCHPAVAHGRDMPPPLPKGDYRREQCYECHVDIRRRELSLSTHLNQAAARCIDCHPAHREMRALLPDSLLSASQRERRGTYSNVLSSNASCLPCHSDLQMFSEMREGFVTYNTENYHRLHVQQWNIGCIECHDPHGSGNDFLIRDRLITGELMSFMPTGRGASCSISCHGAEHNALEYVNRLP